MSTFKRFQTLNYPENSVITPQTGINYTIRGLKVSEVSKVRGSFLTPSQISPLLNRTIWGCICKKPDEIDSYEKFLNLTTIPDREALLFALYESSFPGKKDITAICSNTECQKTQVISPKLSEMFGMNSYPYVDGILNDYVISKSSDENQMDPEIESFIESEKEKFKKEKQGLRFVDEEDEDNQDTEEEDSSEEETSEDKPKKRGRPSKKNKKDKEEEEKEKKYNILEKIVEVELDGTSIKCFVKQPTLADEEESLSLIPHSNREKIASISNTLMIDRFEERNPNTNKLDNYVSDRLDIVIAQQSLMEDHINKIEKVYSEEFGQYCVSCGTDWKCKYCSTKNHVDLDILEQFFQKIIGR